MNKYGLTAANVITIARILAVPFFVTTVLYYSPQQDQLRYVALGIYVFSAISDIVDGYLARSRGEATDIGAVLDPLADKILLMSAFLSLSMVDHQFPVVSFPIWLVVTVISRDILLMIGSVVLLIFFRRLPITVSWWGKGAMFFQAACVVGILLQWGWSELLWYNAFAFTVISGFDYLMKGLQVLNSLPPERKK